ncbi:hypothetical protein [uncultured Flavobacterium sp.]|uniref:hypothetical protein n=1 Tax=uncultured Flavobacterium sp. TaxID=165435 RepID=UPI0025926DEF|nr:hypothetical protein [uncultured Flavobacterium sp.]
MTALLSLEQFKQVMPSQLRGSINQELIDQINTTLSDPTMFEIYRDNLLSYTQVMKDGKFKMTDYISAIKYCSHKIMGSSNIDAFVKTFPDRYQALVSSGVSSKDISSHVAAYNKNKLVNLILEQAMIPSWVLNQDMYQKALNVQLDLMMNSNSDKVKCDAANSLLTHLKPPEVKKVELDIGLKKDAAMDDLKATLTELAMKQQQFIQAGVAPILDITHQKIVQVVEDDISTT